MWIFFFSNVGARKIVNFGNAGSFGTGFVFVNERQTSKKAKTKTITTKNKINERKNK